MDEEETRGLRVSSLPIDDFLAAPFQPPVNNNLGRSHSVAASYRSTQSHITTVEDKEGLQGFDVSDLEKKHLQRQQTYKFGRSLSLIDRLRGVFSPQWLMTKIEKSIEVFPPEVPDDEVFRRNKSPWIVDVYVSRKYNSTDFHQIRCLLDTGCSHGNIVSKDLVEQLGYTETDYQELSVAESREAITLAGQPFPVEAAILLSWHHANSLKRFCRMRFLISSEAKSYDMIIGAETIDKYKLLSRPVFSLSPGIANYSSTDTSRNYLVIDRGTLKSQVDNIILEKEKEKDKAKKVQIEKQLLEVKYLYKLKCQEVKIRDAKGTEVKKNLQADMEKATKEWDSEHADNTTDLVATRFWANRKKSPSSKALPNKKDLKSTSDQVAKTEKAPSSRGPTAT